MMVVSLRVNGNNFVLIRVSKDQQEPASTQDPKSMPYS